MRVVYGLPFAGPMLVVMAVFFVAPILVLGAASFLTPEGTWTLSNYGAFLGDPFAMQVLLRTVLLSLKVVLGVTLLGLPIALLYWHSGPRVRMLILVATLLPMLTSNVVRTFSWVVILGRNGPISTTLLAFGVTDKPFPLLFSETGVLMALCQIELPLLVLPMIAVMARAERNLVEAAEVLGAGRWRVFGTVLLPMLAPAIFSGWVLVFASATTSYVTQSVIGGARIVYLAQFIYREIGILFRWPMAAAVSFLLLATTGVLMLMLSALARHRRLAIHA